MRVIFFVIWTQDLFRESFTKTATIHILKVLNYQPPLKQKSFQGNHTPFMTKELSKAIMTKFKVKNSYVK